MNRRVMLILVSICLALVFFGQGLQYGFWKDDWNYLWLATQPFHYPSISVLHPGTMAQFFLFEKLFGYRVLLWQIAGLLIKAGATVAVLDLSSAVFRSSRIGMLSAFVFATIPLGIETMHWPSAYIVNIDIWVYGSVIAGFLRAVENGMRIPVSVSVGAVLAFLLDPGRAIALFWVPWFVAGRRFAYGWRRRIGLALWWITGAVIYVGFAVWPAYILWYRHAVPLDTVSLGVALKHLCMAFGNALLGGFVALPHIMGDASRSSGGVRLFVSGILFVLGLILTAVTLRKRKHPDARAVWFCSAWIISFVVIQWVSGPEYIPTLIHRHAALPGVGIAMLVGWLLMRFPTPVRWVGVAVYSMIVWNIGSNVFQLTDTYRRADVSEKNIALVDAAVSHRTLPPIIVVDTANNPLVVPGDFYNQLTWLRMRRGDSQRATVVATEAEAGTYVCRESGFGSAFTISDVYAFSFDSDGRYLKNDTGRIRKNLSSQADITDRCQTSGMGSQ